jgi:cyclopropane fatty-acyl-phospholipid synthase-like methyltransferase
VSIIVSHNIRRYYDYNDKRFRRFGIDTRDHNIHQPLWDCNTKTKRQAANYANHLVLRLIKDTLTEEKDRIKILDLGSGFGATIKYIISNADADALEFSGITISRAQAGFAREKLGERIRIVCKDYHDLSRYFRGMDIVYAIESVVQAQDISVLLREVSRVLKPNGLFVVIDDFIDDGRDSEFADRRMIRDYQANWFADGLMDCKHFQALAGENRLLLKRADNLNPYVKWYMRSRVTALLYLAGLRHADNLYLKSLIGGGARQLAIKRGILNYRMAVFTKSQ